MVRLARIIVTGVVQGVGFRPYVYKIAHFHGLHGWVRNTSGSVEIEVEGCEKNLKAFLVGLKEKAPPIAQIQDVKITYHSPKGYSSFTIEKSLGQEAEYQIISPDIATCQDCKSDIFSPSNHRFRYPFTNCTNCGPRFTIIKDIPYDRHLTTMSKFDMCPQCQQEYDNPSNRRFHAQPNACPSCGPALQLITQDGKQISCADVIRETTKMLNTGSIIALKGLGGFQLVCDATNRTAVNILRSRKQRPAKPFAIMLKDVAEIKKRCVVSPEEQSVLESPQCPIVLLKWLNNTDIVYSVAPNLKHLGVMLPYTPLHHLLLNEVSKPLIVTSGNLSEEPIARDNNEALQRLSGIADYYLIHNRDISSCYDDSVCSVEKGKLQIIRRARGYAPFPIELPFLAKQVLACGAQEKNTFCLTKDNHAFLSQHIGDLESKETLVHFDNTINLYKKMFRINPEAIAHDMHPEYLSTKYALEISAEHNTPLFPVQHHHAHIASCMADNKLDCSVLGIALDGTGYGSDGTIWGGEFLMASYKGFRRLGHLEYAPMPGGVAAIRKPYRMALSYLFTLIGEDVSLSGLALDKIDGSERELIKQQLHRKLNSPITSSCGRLFDAVAALLGFCKEIQFEAQASLELEMLAMETDTALQIPYPVTIVSENGVQIIKLGALFNIMIDEIKSNVLASSIAARFHVTLVDIITRMCILNSSDTGIKQVALSGGVFQNRLLFRLVTEALEREKLEVITHNIVPCNDGGIALGQAVIANYSMS